MAITGLTRTCTANKSGVNGLWICEVADVGTPTVSNGEITALTGSATYHKCVPDIDEIDHTEKIENTPNGSKVTQTLTVKVTNLTTIVAVYIQALLDASPCGMVAIYLDANNKAWLLGWNESDLSNRPLRFKTNDKKTGKAPGEDGNNTMFVLESIMTKPALPFNATLSGTITTGAAAFLTTS
jgi:hypothetical protein